MHSASACAKCITAGYAPNCEYFTRRMRARRVRKYGRARRRRNARVRRRFHGRALPQRLIARVVRSLSLTGRKTSHVAGSDSPAHENSLHSAEAKRASRAPTNWCASPSKNVPWVRSRIPDCCRDERTTLARARQRNLLLALRPRAIRSHSWSLGRLRSALAKDRRAGGGVGVQVVCERCADVDVR
jgi:hypothetical protein